MIRKESNAVILQTICNLGRKVYNANKIIAEEEKKIEDILEDLDEILETDEILHDENNVSFTRVFESLMANFFNNISTGNEDKVILVANIKDGNESLYIENFEETCKNVAEYYQFKVSFLKEEHGPNCIAQFIPKFIVKYTENMEEDKEEE